MVKIAILVSGQVRGKWEQNILRVRDAFPDADVFTSTWSGEGNDDIVDFVHDQPSIDYHPTLDTEPYPTFKNINYKKNMENGSNSTSKKQSQYRTMQILGYDKLLNEISDEYDMCVRMRFDTYTSLDESIDWLGLIGRSYKENVAMGFGCRDTRWKHGVNKMVELPRYYPPVDRAENSDDPVMTTQDWAYYLMDPLIIHPRKLWDSKRVWNLHNNKQLKNAEWGWYQILSEPYKDNHVCYYGGAHIEKYM
jgi:hypothetical protein